MAREPVLAAGGIVLRQEETPLIALVRLRKRNEWVLPKGKLDDGETPREAAEREVLEETGHDVSVHEFLGTLVYESGGRSKVVHYWRMETSGEQVYELMNDVRAVDWLPLEAAVERLSRGYERAFLANVGPLALETFALARPPRRPRAKPSASEKRRGRQAVTPPASLTPQPELTRAMSGPDQPAFVAGDAGGANTSVPATALVTVAQSVDAEFTLPALPPESRNDNAASADRGRRRNLVQKVRDWLRRAA
jgi:8-oxo-dGTP diphosphatase